jgi:uncharacterized protein (DUF697 family)
MTHNNSSIPKSTKQNNSVTINISGESGDLAVNTPENSEVSTQPDKLFQTKKILQRFSGNLVQGVFKLSEKATEIGQGAAKSATEIGQGAAKSATEIGQGAAKSATEIGQGAAKSATEIGQEALRFVGNNTQASQDAKEASVTAHIKRVNLASVKKSVSALKEKFPSKTSEEIAHQVVLQKTLQMTGNASAINMIPGKLAESMGFDQAALVVTQVETVYQIAEAYKLDLSTSERREEVLAIFDRAYRSFRKKKMSINVGSVPTLSLVEGGLSLIPLLGPFLGGALNVGSDSFLSFLIGDIACQLYKEIVAETSPGAALKTFSQETKTQYKQRLW